MLLLHCEPVPTCLWAKASAKERSAECRRGCQQGGPSLRRLAPVQRSNVVDLFEARALGFTNGVDNSDSFLVLFLLVCLFFRALALIS